MASHYQFGTRIKELLDALPPITQQWSAARRGLKQPSRRTITHLRHGAPGDVEGEFGRRIKCGVFRGGKMADEKDVTGPRKLFRVLRAANQKALLRQPAGRFDQKLIEPGLPIFGVSPEIGEIGAIMFT